MVYCHFSTRLSPWCGAGQPSKPCVICGSLQHPIREGWKQRQADKPCDWSVSVESLLRFGFVGFYCWLSEWRRQLWWRASLKIIRWINWRTHLCLWSAMPSLTRLHYFVWFVAHSKYIQQHPDPIDLWQLPVDTPFWHKFANRMLPVTRASTL